MLSIGLMSGTSMDGIDAALLDTDGEGAIVALDKVSVAYTPDIKILLKSAERAMRMARGNEQQATRFYPDALGAYLAEELQYTPEDIRLTANKAWGFSDVIQHSTHLHADAVHQLLSKTGLCPHDIDVVGYHGQTLFHQPAQKKTIQAGDGKQLAELTGITVVNDFRSRDVAAGGQGAPFAPIYHLALATRDNKVPVVVVNCGGIANVSLILNKHIEQLIGFDTGPGNGLIDAFIKKRTKGIESMDKDGQHGLQGVIHEDLIDVLFNDSLSIEGSSYFLMQPPKSLDIRDLMLTPALDALSLADACATLAAFTAEAIVRSLSLLDVPAHHIPSYWVLAGGGGYNPVIKRELTARLKTTFGLNMTLETADEAGWNSCAMEAQLIAYLAVRSLKNLPLSTPGTTRVPVPLSGGKAHLPPLGATAAVKALLDRNKDVLN